MSFDPKSAQSPVLNSPINQAGSTGFAGPIPTDMRFASDHSTLAPHQLPKLPSTQVPSSIKPDLFTNKPVAKSPVQPAVTPTPPTSKPSGQQITLTITSSPNQQAQNSSNSQGTQPTQQPSVQINLQSPNATVNSPVSTPQALTPTTSAAPAHVPRKTEILKWFVIVGLAGIGMKGFFDSLYFILVEFQNFEKALEDHLIETAQVNLLITKSALLVFTTSLAIFFGMQLTMTSSKNLRFFRLFSSIIMGIICAAVLHYANTINVLDTFKNP